MKRLGLATEVAKSGQSLPRPVLIYSSFQLASVSWSPSTVNFIPQTMGLFFSVTFQNPVKNYFIAASGSAGRRPKNTSLCPVRGVGDYNEF